MRRIGIVFRFLIAWLSFVHTAPLTAADGTWSVWLYTQRTGTMRRIDQNGSVLREIVLPLPATAAAAGYPDNVAVSHNGGLFAYLITRDADQVTQLLVYDTGYDSIMTNFEFPPGAFVSLQSYASPYVFSEMDTQIAFGYGTMAGVWQVLVFDFITNDVFALDGGSPLALSGGADPLALGALAVPVVHAYRGGTVDFSLTAINQAFAGPSFAWDTVSNTLIRTDTYPTIYGDTLLMTGESVVPALDEAFPMRADSFYPINTLRVYTPELGVLFPFMASGARIIDVARFAQNGELIAVSLVDESENRRIELYRRDGGSWGFYVFAPTSLWGMFDGFVFTGASPVDPTATDLYYEDTRATAASGDVAKIWTSPTNEYVRIVWTSDNFMIGPSSPTPWGMLGAPTLVASALAAPPLPTAGAVFIPPTLMPTFAPPTVVAAPSGLAVGADAFINTTEGDRLRLRAGAGRTFAILRELENGTRVTLIEGPRAADGLVWWRVRLADGTSGWVVEAVDGVVTLVPLFAG